MSWRSQATLVSVLLLLLLTLLNIGPAIPGGLAELSDREEAGLVGAVRSVENQELAYETLGDRRYSARHDVRVPLRRPARRPLLSSNTSAAL